MSRLEVKAQLEAITAELESAQTYPDEKKRIYKVLDEALTHCEVVISEYDVQRKRDADKAKQDAANKEANEAANKAAAEKAKTKKK